MNLHILRIPGIPCDIQTFKLNCRDSWETAAAVYQAYHDSYYGHDEEEIKWLYAASDILKETTPEKYKTGCHILKPAAGFMGEDIYVVDSVVKTASHHRHNKCHKYAVVERQSSQFCVFCNVYLM